MSKRPCHPGSDGTTNQKSEQEVRLVRGDREGAQRRPQVERTTDVQRHHFLHQVRPFLLEHVGVDTPPVVRHQYDRLPGPDGLDGFLQPCNDLVKRVTPLRRRRRTFDAVARQVRRDTTETIFKVRNLLDSYTGCTDERGRITIAMHKCENLEGGMSFDFAVSETGLQTPTLRERGRYIVCGTSQGGEMVSKTSNGSRA